MESHGLLFSLLQLKVCNMQGMSVSFCSRFVQRADEGFSQTGSVHFSLYYLDSFSFSIKLLSLSFRPDIVILARKSHSLLLTFVVS